MLALSPYSISIRFMEEFQSVQSRLVLPGGVIFLQPWLSDFFFGISSSLSKHLSQHC